MMNLQIGSDSLGTQPPFIYWKIVAWLETNHVIILNQEVHAALHSAVRTMRRHDLVYDAIGSPAIVRRIVQMWAKGFNNLFEIGDLAHK